MKIIHVSESISTLAGGLQFTAVSLSRTFSELGHDVLFLSGEDSGSVNTMPVNYLLLEKIGLGRLKILKNLETIIETENPDLIVQHGIWSLFNCQITRVSKRKGIPYIVVTHGMLDPYILNSKKVQKKLLTKAFQYSNLKNALFIRALNLNERIHINDFIDTDVIVAPNGIDLVNYDESVIRDENKICFLGRIDNKKSVIELCESWKQLIDSDLLPFDAKLEIAGWSGDEKYLERFKKITAGVESITYVGAKFGDDKRALFNSSGAFILPSKGEGLPTAVLEAWRDECVVIMSRQCNFPSETYGFSCIETGADLKSISESILKYYSMSTNIRESLRKKGKEELKNYSWPNIAKSVLEHVAEK